MRNLLGGVVGSILAIILAYFFLNITPVAYPESVEAVSFLFTGAVGLSMSIESILSLNSIVPLVLIWTLVGFSMAPFAVSAWNLLRTTFWAGVMIAMLALISTLLVDPEFWVQADRNLMLTMLFAKTVAAAMISFPASLLAYKIKKRWQRTKPEPLPDKIETLCDCGAIYKSNPLVCVECGNQLREETKPQTVSSSGS